MIDPKRPVKVIHTGHPNPAALRALIDYIIDCAIERDRKQAEESKKRFHWIANRAPAANQTFITG